MQRISTRLAPWSRLNYTPAAGAERGLPHRATVLLLAIASLLIGCVVVKASGPTTLKEAFKNDFLIGVAINEKQSETGTYSFNSLNRSTSPAIEAASNRTVT